MPIHLRAEPGDYADGCLLPGDPLRAKYIAETFFEDAVEVTSTGARTLTRSSQDLAVIG